ncbi:MAG: hypothetical protein RL238_1401 [Actinomycetota bacterium]|jgi:hypothetical protein
MAAPGDDVWIELIDADPTVFGGAPRAAASEPEQPASPRRPFPTRAVLVSGLVCLVMAGLVAGLLAWKPWYDDPRLVLDDTRVRASELSERLVFDPPPSELRASTEHGNDIDAAEAWSANSVGFFFADPEATFDPDDGDDRWFGFYARPSSDPRTPLIFGQTTIAGAPAEVSNETDGDLIEMAWGPVDGFTYTAAASHLTVEQATAIADQLRIEEGKPVLLDDRTLVGLEPLGSFGDYLTLLTLSQFTQDTGAGLDRLVGVYYGFDREAVVSVPGRPEALDMLWFVLNLRPTEGEVHGLPAYGFTKGAGPFGGMDVSTVVWFEGGRIIIVAAAGEVDEVFELAQTVRPATDDEWQAVLALE